MLPWSRETRCMSSRATVDLPEPLSPTTARTSPVCSTKLTSSTARTCAIVLPRRPPRTGKALLKWLTSSRGRAGTLCLPVVSDPGLINRSDVEGVTEAVADEIEAQRRHEDHGARQRRIDRCDVDRLSQRAQHCTPFRLGRRHAGAEKGQ